jgi:glycerol-3-phosphate dehydrogenase
MEEEVDFLLQTAAQYLAKSPARADVCSVFAGIRPLVGSSHSGNTAAMSRDHTIRIEDSGMVTICGGKWTTYRRMAEDCVNQAATLAQLPERPCVTVGLKIHGFRAGLETTDHLDVYGSDAPAVRQIIRESPDLGIPLHPELPYTGAEVVWAARQEMACTVEDVLARRTRALFLRARAAIQMAPAVADLLCRELGQDDAWKADQIRSFRETARGYLLS